MNDQRERIMASAMLGGGAGAALWLLHGVARVLGIPRLLAYVAAGTGIAFLVDVYTSER